MKYKICMNYLISYIEHCQTDTERKLVFEAVSIEEVLNCIKDLNNNDNIKEFSVTISRRKE